MALNVKKLVQANDETAITNAIASVNRRGQTLQLDIHKLLVVLATRWKASGDGRPVVKHVSDLVANMPQGVRQKAIHDWVETFFGMVWSKDDETFVLVKNDKGKPVVKGKNLDLDEIANTRWWEFKKKTPKKPMDFAERLLKDCETAENRLEKPVDGDSIDKRMINAVKAIADGKPRPAQDMAAEAALMEPEERAQLIETLRMMDSKDEAQRAKA